MTQLWFVVAACYPLALLSAVVPWVNAEFVLLSALAVVDGPLAAAAVALVITAGQMSGKAVMFCAARRGGKTWQRRLEPAVNRWRLRLEGSPRSALCLVFVSATIGIPPFYFVSIAAGALGVAFSRFLAVGTIGRLVHFSTVALAPYVIRSAA